MCQRGESPFAVLGRSTQEDGGLARKQIHAEDAVLGRRERGPRLLWRRGDGLRGRLPAAD